MRRREFITLLGGTAIWPVVAGAQQGDRLRRVGVLLAFLESDAQVQTWTKALETSLQELGWNSGRNISRQEAMLIAFSVARRFQICRRNCPQNMSLLST
jgi:putative ABC transport system substrate-binding protein